MLPDGALLPLAHAGHYAIWILYAIPALIVLGAIIRSTLIERRRARDAVEREARPEESGSNGAARPR